METALSCFASQHFRLLKPPPLQRLRNPSFQTTPKPQTTLFHFHNTLHNTNLIISIPKTSKMSDDFLEPADAGNFLQRYHEARAASSAPSTPKMTAKAPPAPQSPESPSAPRKIPSQPRKEPTWRIWEQVFHPGGRIATSADRYDLSKGQTSRPGMSASEMHARGTGIHLDEKNEE